ncbi:MAG: rod shape-determining protein MreC [Finegoldia sp.]|nr:rod shape-determining protein MreC [Finegoldia sp.]
MNKYKYNGKLKKNIYFITVSLILIFLIAFSANRGKSLGSNIVGTITSPVNKVFYFVSSKTAAAFESVFGSRQMRAENVSLKEENAELSKEVDDLKRIVSQRTYLQEEYELISKSKDIKTKALIAGKEPGNLFTSFVIDKGSKDGLKVGDVVVQAVSSQGDIEKGLVGLITGVGYNNANVEAIINDNNKVGFMIARTGDVGIIDKADAQLLEGYMYDESKDVKVGDRVVTSGLGGVYPADIKIGEVSEVSFDETSNKKMIKVTSAIKFNNMYRVMVLDGRGK